MIAQTARNTHRTYLLKPVTGNMSIDQTSETIDFKEMVVGSVQAKWDGNNALTGKLVVEASNIDEDDWFDEIDCSEVTLDDDGTKAKRKTKLFNLGWLGYRFLRVRYFAGDNTQGTIQVIALGKKGG